MEHAFNFKFESIITNFGYHVELSCSIQHNKYKLQVQVYGQEGMKYWHMGSRLFLVYGVNILKTVCETMNSIPHSTGVVHKYVCTFYEILIMWVLILAERS